jgi:hypothetical protein
MEGEPKEKPWYQKLGQRIVDFVAPLLFKVETKVGEEIQKMVEEEVDYKELFEKEYDKWRKAYEDFYRQLQEKSYAEKSDPDFVEFIGRAYDQIESFNKYIEGEETIGEDKISFLKKRLDWLKKKTVKKVFVDDLKKEMKNSGLQLEYYPTIREQFIAIPFRKNKKKIKENIDKWFDKEVIKDLKLENLFKFYTIIIDARENFSNDLKSMVGRVISSGFHIKFINLNEKIDKELKVFARKLFQSEKFPKFYKEHVIFASGIREKYVNGILKELNEYLRFYFDKLLKGESPDDTHIHHIIEKFSKQLAEYNAFLNVIQAGTQNLSDKEKENILSLHSFHEVVFKKLHLLSENYNKSNIDELNKAIEKYYTKKEQILKQLHKLPQEKVTVEKEKFNLTEEDWKKLARHEIEEFETYKEEKNELIDELHRCFLSIKRPSPKQSRIINNLVVTAKHSSLFQYQEFNKLKTNMYKFIEHKNKTEMGKCWEEFENNIKNIIGNDFFGTYEKFKKVFNKMFDYVESSRTIRDIKHLSEKLENYVLRLKKGEINQNIEYEQNSIYDLKGSIYIMAIDYMDYMD